jgi:hypothetical protein
LAASGNSRCREALAEIYRREGVTAAFEVGEYWDKQAQVDVVWLREDGWTDIGECKWGKVGSPQTIVKELRAKKATYPNPRNATIQLRVFTREPVKETSDGSEIRWHDLADLYMD